MANRCAKPLEEAGRAGLMDGLGRHTLGGAPGEQPRIGMTIVRTYASAFTSVMGEVIRIFYRSREENVVLPNSKTGDFATYSLPFN